VTPDQAIDELISDRPPLHSLPGGPQDWGLAPEVLRWLADHVREDWDTLETGCGHSTIVFALRGAEHTAVAPHQAEHDRVREWCQEHGFSTAGLTLMCDLSQRVLPRLEGPLDLGLIDGSHGFPTPFIDWYYIAERLQAGGRLILDDTDLPTVGLLTDFLLAEEGRWSLECELGRAVVFRKLTSEGPIPPMDWTQQPWVIAEMARQRRLGRLRQILRPRTRLRRVTARLRS
jgi:methyltransferase family protein